MKGLILKDIYNVRFQIVCGLILLLLPGVFMIIAGRELDNEVMYKVPELMTTIVYGIINYIAITLCSSFLLNTISDDIKSGWAKIQLVMPVSRKEIIGGKLAASGIVIALLMFFSLISNIIGIIFFDRPPELMIAMPIALALLQMAVLSAAAVLGYRTRGKIMAVYIVIILIVGAGIIALLYGFFTYKISVSAMRWIGYGGVPLFSAIVTVSCYFWGSKAVDSV